MLASAVVQQIEQLLAEGNLSQRKIAKVVGVSRGVISEIAGGRRPDYEARRGAFRFESQPRGPIERCPTCGARVYLPCRLCYVRKMQVREQTLLRKLRRHSREETLRRMMIAILRAALESQRLDATPSPKAPQAGAQPAEPSA